MSMAQGMPSRCNSCSSTSCCISWQPPLPVEWEPLDPDAWYWDQLYNPQRYLPFWSATRARARVTRTREDDA